MGKIEAEDGVHDILFLEQYEGQSSGRLFVTGSSMGRKGGRAMHTTRHWYLVETAMTAFESECEGGSSRDCVDAYTVQKPAIGSASARTRTIEHD